MDFKKESPGKLKTKGDTKTKTLEGTEASVAYNYSNYWTSPVLGQIHLKPH